MDNLFTFRDNVEGKIGIGKVPEEIQSILESISTEYYDYIPDKDSSTYHTWFGDMPINIKSKVEQIQSHHFWNKLCDGSDKCIKFNASEMDELYYSNPKNNLTNINLYGASGNYDIHKDCIFNFDGVKFYRILIGLTDGNDNITTYFKNLNVGHKINSGDYIVFDFDNSEHQVIKEKPGSTPRILLKLHYIVCENCKHSPKRIEIIKNIYIYYEFITRYVMQFGTDPKTFSQFCVGLFCQFYMNNYTIYVLLSIIVITTFLLNIKLIPKNLTKVLKYNLFVLTLIYFIIVLFFYFRYKLFGIK
jgi:hypothetical protein